jgi:hypothetical protein
MKTASRMLALAERRQHAIAWLDLAAERRRLGLFEEARSAIRVSRLWPAPRIPS